MKPARIGFTVGVIITLLAVGGMYYASHSLNVEKAKSSSFSIKPQVGKEVVETVKTLKYVQKDQMYSLKYPSDWTYTEDGALTHFADKKGKTISLQLATNLEEFVSKFTPDKYDVEEKSINYRPYKVYTAREGSGDSSVTFITWITNSRNTSVFFSVTVADKYDSLTLRMVRFLLDDINFNDLNVSRFFATSSGN